MNGLCHGLILVESWNCCGLCRSIDISPRVSAWADYIRPAGYLQLRHQCELCSFCCERGRVWWSVPERGITYLAAAFAWHNLALLWLWCGRYTYLDTSGRPVLVFEKANVVPDHNVIFHLDYHFNRLSLLREPLLLIGGTPARVPLLLCMLLQRSGLNAGAGSRGLRRTRMLLVGGKP